MATRRKAPLREAQRSDELVSDVRVALRAAAAGSFSATARSLGVQVSTVARSVQRLEESVGVPLFARTPRGLRVNDAGTRYLEHARAQLDREAAMRAELVEAREARGGRLRVTVPVVVAQRVLPDVVQRFHHAHPAVRLEVHATDAIVDLVRDGVDLAIRLGPLPASDLRARRIARFRRVLCAAPELAALSLRRPADLAERPCLGYGGAGPLRWRFVGPRGARAEVLVPCAVRANDAQLLVALAERGLGIARVPEWLAHDALERGSVVRVLPAWRCDGVGEDPTMEAVWPDDPSSARARAAFVSALETTLRAMRAPGIEVRATRG